MRSAQQRIEWPTVGVGAAIWVLIVFGVASYDRIPQPLSIAALALGAAWYSSLQHEVVHGHPFGSHSLNMLLAGLPVGLTCPIGLYRQGHLAHHDDAWLTDPAADPESRFVTAQQWQAMPAWRRWCLRQERCLAGWLTLGTMRRIAESMVASHRNAWTDTSVRMMWLTHWSLVGVIIAIVSASSMPAPLFVVVVATAWASLGALRSFAEHDAGPLGLRCAVTKASPFMSLLLLHNNLHHTHHRYANVAWYELPRLAIEADSEAVGAAGAGLYTGGYWELVRRYAFRSKGEPVHPEWHAL